MSVHIYSNSIQSKHIMLYPKKPGVYYCSLNSYCSGVHNQNTRNLSPYTIIRHAKNYHSPKLEKQDFPSTEFTF